MIVISERFSSRPDAKFRLSGDFFGSWQKTFFSFQECNQDLVAPATYHIPIVVVCVCQSVREHQHLERMPCGAVFLNRPENVAVVIVRRNERIKQFSKEAEGRPKGTVDSRKKGPVKIFQN